MSDFKDARHVRRGMQQALHHVFGNALAHVRVRSRDAAAVPPVRSAAAGAAAGLLVPRFYGLQRHPLQ
jgi:hypothetical protein